MSRLPQAAREALGARFDYEEARIQTLPMKFACPSVVLRDGDDQQRGRRAVPALERGGGGRGSSMTAQIFQDVLRRVRPSGLRQLEVELAEIALRD